MCGIWAVLGISVEEVYAQCKEALKIAHRGPDAFRIENIKGLKNCCLGFHHLAIVSDKYGMQPLRITQFPHLWLLYNGEIYNYENLAKGFSFTYQTDTDAECILHLYEQGGIDLATTQLDGVFCFLLIDTKENKVFFARDTIGVRPGFRLMDKNGVLAVCSEAKGLINVLNSCEKSRIQPLKPGSYEEFDLLESGKVTYVRESHFHVAGQVPQYCTTAPPLVEEMYINVRNKLTNAVKKRMMGLRRIGCLLSGGLDSSLIAALVVKYAKEMGLQYPVQTFSIGMHDSPDLLAARKVATHLGTEHHEIRFKAEEGLAIIEDTIYHLESYDIITIRGSTGLWLISKYISEQTDSTVIFSGEGADEIAQGYIYFHNAPTPEDAHQESKRLLNDLYLFDVLRADRTTAGHGLELRVPFLDHDFLAYYLSLPHDIRCPIEGVEKHLLRKAFDGTGLIPQEILWRPKEAFNDGMSSTKKSWFEYLQEHIECQVSDEDLAMAASTFPFNTPQTKEALLYRRLFEQYYPGMEDWIPFFWMPKWSDATDPSARLLKHYRNSET